MSHIVVGVDGSECSKPAFRFAAEEAALRGEPLRVVSVWQVPVTVYSGPVSAVPLDPKIYADAARGAAQKQIDEGAGSAGEVEVELVVREGGAAHVLIEESSSATMLVVGSRGHGGFAGLLLGSVSQQCAAHARCPVVIVHDDGAAPPGAE